MTSLNKHISSEQFTEHSQAMHRETIEWLSDIEFCRTEFAFLLKLIDREFLKVMGKQKPDDLEVLEKKVESFLEKTLGDLYSKTNRHEHNLFSINENVSEETEKLIRSEHSKLSGKIAVLMTSVKEIKKEIFEVVEKQLKVAKEITTGYEEGE